MSETYNAGTGIARAGERRDDGHLTLGESGFWCLEITNAPQQAWLARTIPGERYAITFDFGEAQIFEPRPRGCWGPMMGWNGARDTHSILRCGRPQWQVEIVRVDDEYRAKHSRSAVTELAAAPEVLHG